MGGVLSFSTVDGMRGSTMQSFVDGESFVLAEALLVS